ncbi:hypothetical protein [Yersinia frederiksenii]|nr:hypothetical protein [Yersinia frederiksenii]
MVKQNLFVAIHLLILRSDRVKRRQITGYHANIECQEGAKMK